MRIFRSTYTASETGYLPYETNIPNKLTDDGVFWGDQAIPIHERYEGIAVNIINSEIKVLFVFNDETITHFQIARDTPLVKCGNKYPCSAEIIDIMREQPLESAWFEIEGHYIYVYMKPEDYMEMILKI